MREVQGFLVRIFGAIGELPLGCGFPIDKDKCHVLTCCHVVNVALNRRAVTQPSEPVYLDFPLLTPNRLLKAEVERWHYAIDDPLHDICVLKLLDDAPSNAQPAPMVRAPDYSGDAFRAFGFPKDFESKGREVKGVLGAKQVLGCVLAEGISQFGFFIEGGFSGTPIWNTTHDGVCGMAFQVDKPATLKVASIIPTEQLMQVANEWIELSGAIPSYLRRLITKLGNPKLGVLQYVDLSAQIEVSAENQVSGFDIDDEFGFSELVPKTLSPEKETVKLGKIRDVLDKHQRFVLVGEAGSSKTTTLRRLALEAAQKRMLDDNAPLPLLLYLPRWETGLSPEDFIRGQWIKEGLSNIGDPIRFLMTGSALLYLDGLNEMGGQGIDNAKKLRDWLASSASMIHVIVTCRRSAYSGDFELDMPVVQIEPMSDEHIRQFVRNYLPTKSELFLEQVLPTSDETRDDKRQMYQLVRNPYMLRALIEIFDNSPDDQLPQNVGKLFSMLVRALARREGRRHTESWLDFNDRFPIVEDALARLAFAMIDERKGTEVSITYASQFLDHGALQAAQDASFVESIYGNVRFVHQLMQEYFAAIRLRSVKSTPAYPRSLKKAFSEFTQMLIPSLRYPILSALLHGIRMLLYLGLIRRPTKLESVADNPHLFWSNGIDNIWEGIIVALCEMEQDANPIIQQICEVNPYLAVKCCKNIEMVSSLTDTKIVKTLMPYLAGENYHHPLQLLGDFGTDLATKTIVEFLHKSSADSWRREHAVQALGRTKNRFATQPLFDALGDDDTEVRWFAALSLAEVPNVPVDEIIYQFISTRTHSDSYGSYTIALEKIGARAIPQLVSYIINNDNIEIQRELGHVLVQITPTYAAIPALLKLMIDTDESWRSIRQCAVDRLAELGAVTELAGLLDTLNDWMLKLRISGRLENIGTDEALAAVERWRRRMS